MIFVTGKPDKEIRVRLYAVQKKIEEAFHREAIAKGIEKDRWADRLLMLEIKEAAMLVELRRRGLWERDKG